MTQTRRDPHQWCADMQLKLMAAMDAAWLLAETSDDPAVIAKARAKAKLCAEMAASARKVALLKAEPPRRLAHPAEDTPPETAQAVIARSALERLKAGGRRGRL